MRFVTTNELEGNQVTVSLRTICTDENVGGNHWALAEAGKLTMGSIVWWSRTLSQYALKREGSRLRSRGIRIVVEVLSKKRPSVLLRLEESHHTCLRDESV